jgi:hypothetical protein
MSLIVWPITALWRLVTGILAMTGRLVAILIGLVLMIIGVGLTLTIVGAIVGVPMFAFGLTLVIRGLF